MAEQRVFFEDVNVGGTRLVLAAARRLDVAGAVAFLASTVRFVQRGPEEGKGGEQEQGWTSQVLDLPGGRWIVGLVAIVLLAILAFAGALALNALNLYMLNSWLPTV